jgi:hypothetical protein
VFLLESRVRRSRGPCCLHIPILLFLVLVFSIGQRRFQEAACEPHRYARWGDVERLELEISHTGLVCPKPEECVQKRRIEFSGSGGTAMSIRFSDSKNRLLLQLKKKDCELCLYYEGKRVKEHSVAVRCSVHCSCIDFKSPNVRFIWRYPNRYTCES